MRRILIVLCLVIGFVGPASAKDVEIEETIGAQLDAFLVGDLAEAFGYASPTIQKIFRTPENFGFMVRDGYPMVWQPSDVQFLELREISGSLWQKVMVTDAQGNIHLLDYQMVELESGWKINAVQLTDSATVGA
ncbi:DUF4864 domain-containing protein [Arenibacterium sp. CAU 1754]